MFYCGLAAQPERRIHNNSVELIVQVHQLKTALKELNVVDVAHKACLKIVGRFNNGIGSVVRHPPSNSAVTGRRFQQAVSGLSMKPFNHLFTQRFRSSEIVNSLLRSGAFVSLLLSEIERFGTVKVIHGFLLIVDFLAACTFCFTARQILFPVIAVL